MSGRQVKVRRQAAYAYASTLPYLRPTGIWMCIMAYFFPKQAGMKSARYRMWMMGCAYRALKNDMRG